MRSTGWYIFNLIWNAAFYLFSVVNFAIAVNQHSLWSWGWLGFMLLFSVFFFYWLEQYQSKRRYDKRERERATRGL